jgi:hypothetical protein
MVGSSWRTELCISNPYSETLTVKVSLHQGGDVGSYNVGVPSSWVVCNDDFILDWFDLTDFQGGLSAVAHFEDNPGIEWPIFPIAVKVYNQTNHGTYGLSVNPVPAIPITGDEHQDFLASGIRHYGTPGVDGFRTSIGVFNPDHEAQTVTMMVADYNGEIVWNRTEIVAAKSQIQFLLPGSIDIVAGSAIISNKGTESSGIREIFPYVTVTENETGDGRYIGAGQIWIQLIKSD